MVIGQSREQCGYGSFRDPASQVVVRRVAEMINIDPFVNQALTHVGKQFTGNLFYARGTQYKIQVNLEPREHPVAPPL